jgi:hypothetical protein
MIDIDVAPTSPRGASDQPSWPRPRTPIPPHRLAKLANALGISAPVPQEYNDSASEPRRSPTPSVASTPQLIPHSPVPSFQSKFLLHVVPPLHIPHDPDSFESVDLPPPPSSASGYHTQFSRGILVPLLPTLQSQLYAIAKEYALPSTTGIILYLVSSAQSPNSESALTVPDEPGPRLSEDIWKHLWTRVTKVELETYSRLATPTTPGLGFVSGGRSSPLFPQDLSSTPNALRPLISSARTPQSFVPPPTPTGSSASSASFNPSTQTPLSETSQSQVDTSDTTFPSDSRAATLDLPGLTSPSVIPILAKVEFDIDKRKAAWYGPWIRSRKLNHQKREQRCRAQSDSSALALTEDDSAGSSEPEPPKVAPLPLRLVDRQAVPRFLLSADEEDDNHEADSVRLSESPLGLEDTPSTADDRDLLTDTFEPDGDTWADLRSNNTDQSEREIGSNIVEPALGGHASSESAKSDGEPVNGIDEQDGQALGESRERPKLSLDIPSSPPNSTRHSLPTKVGTVSANTFRKAAPPPLIIVPNFDPIISADPSPLPNTESARLAYLRDGLPTSSSEGVNDMPGIRRPRPTSHGKTKTPTEDKRIGTFFEELDLGLEFEDTGEVRQQYLTFVLF